MDKLLSEIRQCTICEEHLTHGVNPILSVSSNSKIIVIGQAPGSVVHRTGIPWDDKSGDRLREWLGVDKNTFYNEDLFALIPMGFCYPGKGASGDLPPRRECAPKWHDPVLKNVREKKLTLLIGSYAQHYYLKEKEHGTLTETVRCFSEFLPEYMPLPHPSPRNNIWLKKNKWFENTVLPVLKQKTQQILAVDSQ